MEQVHDVQYKQYMQRELYVQHVQYALCGTVI